MGKIVKKIKKLIPKEIKPAVPYIAAYFGGPMLASKFSMNPAFAKALSASVASKAQGDDTKTALRSGIFAAAPDVISGGLQKAGTALTPQTTEALKQSLKFTGGVGPNAVPISQQIGSVLSSAGETLASTGFTPKDAISFKDAAKVIGAQSTIEGGIRAAELNEKALRDYEAQLAEQGILDKADRRNKIFGYFTNAGYDTGEVNSFLDKYGYADGGRVGFENGGIRSLEKPIMNPYKKSTYSTSQKMLGSDDEEDNDEDLGISAKDFLEALSKPREKEFSSSDLMDSLKGIMSGYEMATGQSIMGAKPQPTRFGLQEGGIPVTPAARKTIRELIEAGMLEDEGEGILDLIKKNPGAVGGPIMPMKPSEPKSQTAPIQMMASSDRYTELVEQFMYEGYDYNTASEMAFKALQEDDGYAEGGMINTGGREMDMRGGGFIPIGKKERADDVPARLSKNEFVMTADAVRGAGNGSINKGAKRMYDLMNKLESKV